MPTDTDTTPDTTTRKPPRLCLWLRDDHAQVLEAACELAAERWSWAAATAAGRGLAGVAGWRWQADELTGLARHIAAARRSAAEAAAEDAADQAAEDGAELAEPALTVHADLAAILDCWPALTEAQRASLAAIARGCTGAAAAKATEDGVQTPGDLAR